MKIGIESISMYVPRYGMDLRLLADARNVDYAKYKQGIGQEFMSIPSPDEDIVTMGANAAEQAMEGIDPQSIRTVIFATESGIDQSKAAAIYVHKLLDLPQNCRTVEMKQACCSSTSALHFALATIALKPNEKVLIIASDIAKYGLGSAGEPTQGAGAVAMVISATPRILELGPDVGYFTKDVMDFWRPNYKDEALVDGKYSIKVYMDALEHCWEHYQADTNAAFEDFDYFCYHLPFSRMGTKAHSHLARQQKVPLSSQELQRQIEPSLRYNRITGNAYTASLYMGLLSLLDSKELNLAHKKIGFFSYGSGCMGAFFGGTVLPGYQDHLYRSEREAWLRDRKHISYTEYVEFYTHRLPQNGHNYRTSRHRSGSFRLAGVENHQRIYERVPASMGAAADSGKALAAAPAV
ncbi:hydroxymethylglutaryl-CoA synthase [Kiritimatiellota bacterium B12222]|nr:hydroxymethylglutaryl-CoA synthase [Kiritimatiellota bacterium B12222]